MGSGGGCWKDKRAVVDQRRRTKSSVAVDSESPLVTREKLTADNGGRIVINFYKQVG